MNKKQRQGTASVYYLILQLNNKSVEEFNTLVNFFHRYSFVVVMYQAAFFLGKRHSAEFIDIATNP